MGVWEIYGPAIADILPNTGHVLRKKQEEEAENKPLADIDYGIAGGNTYSRPPG